jgi:17beta-estradiol 17-dehydrogenase/3alpha(17beta)-hydroxysteroid dehydrogenase (NAD+)
VRMFRPFSLTLNICFLPLFSFPVATALAAAHCHVVLADVNTAAMEQVVQRCADSSSSNPPPRIVRCNVTEPEQVQSLMDQADQSSQEPATILVNCAGITRDNWIGKMTDQEWDDVLDVNLKATFLTCRAFLQPSRLDYLQQLTSDHQYHGSIINVGSVVSEFGNLGQANYAASKGGVLGLTRALAKEVATRHSIRVNAVIPGFIETPMAQAVPDDVKEQIIPKIAMKRFGQPEEVADLVAFLASPRSSYITGECVTVSGMISL